MPDLAIRPMQWANVADLHDVPPLSEADFECMREIREVLLSHGKVDRFALHLLHKHFDLQQGEILVEYNDAGPREQYFRVEKATEDILANSIPTTWILDSVRPSARCVCATRMGQGHLGRHETGHHETE
jgi:hypothetical protein